MKLKMSIKEWASINGMTPDEFTGEIAATMAAIGGFQLDSVNNTDKADGFAINLEDHKYRYKVIIMRKVL